MVKKRISRIISQVLVIALLVPNIPVGAVEIETKDANKEVNIEYIYHDDMVCDHDHNNTEEITEDESKESIDEEQNETQLTEKVDTEVIEQENKEIEENVDSEDAVLIEGQQTVIEESEKVMRDENESLLNSEYEVVKVNSQHLTRATTAEEYETEEERLKSLAMANYSLLKTKTNDKFEIALAYSDGSYRFINSTDTYDEAMNLLASTPLSSSNDSVLPVIINEYGQVVYSTKSMVRFIKNVNGVPHLKHIPYYNNDGSVNPNSCYYKNDKGDIVLRPTHVSETTNIYSSGNLSSAYTYINQNYVEDAPAIATYSTAARIQVAGYTGYINNKYQETFNGKTYNWSDYLLVPVNQVTNPSYYIVQDGILYHYISFDLVAKANSNGTKIPLGPAPSYLTPNKRYLSYDGNYFYDGTYIDVALNRIIDNLNAGNKEHAVNKNNPHYNYYQYLPFRSKTIYTAQELNNYIKNNTTSDSKLRDLGQALKDAESKYGVNALLTLAVAINESAWGTSEIARTKNNLFGIKAFDSNTGAAQIFNTPRDSVKEFAKSYISLGYANPNEWRCYGGHLGNKRLGANVKYASDPYWAEKATKYAFGIDLGLSGSVSSLLDTNAYQLGIYNQSKQVNNINNNELYTSKVGTSFILLSKDTVNVGGNACYPIYPEITNSNFNGEYSWEKGYINTSGISLINTQKSIQPDLIIHGGETRFETAVELSKSKFKTSDSVVLINRNSIFDGISATPLAAAIKAPILYTEAGYLQDSTKNEIARLKPSTVIIIGGTGVVTNNVVNEIESMGINSVKRLGGATRYDTALEVAKYIDTNCYDVSEVFVVNGNADADAMSVGAVGGMNKMPILLTKKDKIPDNTYNWLANEQLTNGYIIGGTGIVSNNVLNTLNSITKLDIRSKRVGGADRQETNALIIDRFYPKNVNAVYAARSHILFDALAVGPIAAIDKSPVVLISNDISNKQKEVLNKIVSRKIIQAGLDFPQQGINSLRKVIKAFNL